MADELVLRVGSDVSELKQGLQEGQQAVDQFQDTAKGATKAMTDLGQKGAKSTKDLISELSKITGAERNLSNYRRQLMQMTKDIQDLTINYRNLSDADKNSDIGKQTLQRINELTKKAGDYRDAVLDAQQSINVLASDTANWDAAKQGIQALSGALQGFVSLGVLGKKSTDDLIKVISTLQAVEKGFNGVITVTNALQKQSSLMQGIMRIQSAALTKATELQTGATVAQTVAQKALNLVAKANPYVLLATAILAVVAAVGTWLAVSKRNVSVQKDLAEAQDNINKALNDSHGESGKTIAKFVLLERQYKSLKSEAEKQTWINKHQEEFKDLNLSIKDVNDADNVFINHAKDVIKAMRLRAEVSAMMTQYQEEYAKAYKKSLEIEEDKQSSFMPSNTFRRDWKKAGISEGDYTHTTTTIQSMSGAYSQNLYSLTKSGIQKMKDYWKRQGEASMEAFNDGMAGTITLMEQKLAEAEKLENSIPQYNPGDNNNGGNNNGKPEAVYKNEINLLEQENASLEEQKKFVEHLSDKWKELDSQIEENKKKIQELKNAEEVWRNSQNRTQFTPIQPLPTIQSKAEYSGGNTIKLRPIPPTPQELAKAYQDAYSKAGEIADWVRIGVIDKDKAKEMIDGLQQGLNDAGITIDIPVNIDAEALDNLRSKIEDWTSVFSAPINAISSIKSAFESLQETMEDPDADGWDKFFAVFRAGESIMQAVSTVLTIMSAVTQLLTGEKRKNTSATIAETTAEAASLGVKEASAEASIKEGAAEGLSAATKGAKSVADIPVVGWVLAGVALATLIAGVIAAISTIKGFAEGGIVGGNSYYGDKILARLNSGELIVNQRDQEKLWKQMNSSPVVQNTYQPTGVNGKVEFVVTGDNLVGVLENYNKKMNNI